MLHHVAQTLIRTPLTQLLPLIHWLCGSPVHKVQTHHPQNQNTNENTNNPSPLHTTTISQTRTSPQLESSAERRLSALVCYQLKARRGWSDARIQVRHILALSAVTGAVVSV